MSVSDQSSPGLPWPGPHNGGSIAGRVSDSPQDARQGWTGDPQWSMGVGGEGGREVGRKEGGGRRERERWRRDGREGYNDISVHGLHIQISSLMSWGTK